MSTDWLEIAKEVEQELERAPLGGRQALFEGIANRHALSDKTVRTMHQARLFLTAIGAQFPELAGRLKSAAPVSIEIVARWFRRDPATAMEAAERLAEGRYAVRELDADEKKSRPTSKWAMSGSRSEIVRNICKVAGFRPASRSDRDYGFDLIADAGGPSANLFIVGPYSVEKTYYDRSADLVLKALGLRSMFENVGLVLPAACNIQRFRGGVRFWEKFSGDPGCHVFQEIEPFVLHRLHRDEIAASV